jgi:hypothetical protein
VLYALWPPPSPAQAATAGDHEACAIAALLQCELIMQELIDQRLLQAEEIKASLESLADAQINEGRADPRRAELLFKVAGLLRRSATSISRM